MKFFLDVGGHEGQTLSGILDPKYEFDKIYVFEPVKDLHVKLNKIANQKSNITLLEYGLWNKNATQKVYSPGSVAASIFMTHQDVDENNFIFCRFVNASEWFNSNVSWNDEVFVKLNCEGSEADILLDLLESGEIHKIKNVMIDFDIRKVKGLEDRQFEIIEKLKKANFISYSICEEVMRGPTHALRIQNWLDHAGANRKGISTATRQFFYWLKMALSGKRPEYWWEIKHFAKAHIPLSVLKYIHARRNKN